MNWVDLAVLGIVGISALLGLSRGFVREMLGMGSWLVALYGAYAYGPAFLPFANAHISNPDIAAVAAYAGTFLVLVVVLSLLANLVGRIVQVSALGGLDRTLGLVFGMARGALVVVAGYILLGFMQPIANDWPPIIKQARALPALYASATWLVAELPEKIRPAVAAPPGSAAITADQLGHATPVGSALSRAPGHP
jgi:membrane protein required for colicin V production